MVPLKPRMRTESQSVAAHDFCRINGQIGCRTLGTAACKDVLGRWAVKAKGWRPLRDLDGPPAQQGRGFAAVPEK